MALMSKKLNNLNIWGTGFNKQMNLPYIWIQESKQHRKCNNELYIESQLGKD